MLIPKEWQSVFKHDRLTQVQERCFPRLSDTDRNIIISAPTGTGKTGCMDISLMRLFAGCASKNEEKTAIYIAPTRALCAEREADWRDRFGSVGRECRAHTGDSTDDITPSHIMYHQ